MLPSPSASHTRRFDVSAQLDALGVHTWVMHCPMRHDSPARQAVGVAVRPFGSHTFTRVRPSQARAPGVHIHVTQRPALHDCCAPQAAAL